MQKSLERFIKGNNKKNIFLVTGEKSFSSSGCSELFDEPRNFKIVKFTDFSTNPEFSDLKKGLNLFHKKKCDALVAVGGGSAMDMGKLIAFLSNCKIKGIESIQKYSINGIREIPLMCIPTTAGSGAESTHFSVLYFNNKKYSISNQTMIPDELILNSKYSYSTSKYQKAVSGLDALSQGIESFWAKGSSEESRSYAKKAIELIWNNLYKSVNNNDYESHKQVFDGSILAGKAINISKTTAPHALSYYFTNVHHISHGHAVALTLSKIYALNRKKALKSENEKIQKIFFELDKILGIEDNPVAIINSFISSLNIETNLSLMGINMVKEINDVKSLVNLERFENNPFTINIDEIF